MKSSGHFATTVMLRLFVFLCVAVANARIQFLDNFRLSESDTVKELQATVINLNQQLMRLNLERRLGELNDRLRRLEDDGAKTAKNGKLTKTVDDLDSYEELAGGGNAGFGKGQTAIGASKTTELKDLKETIEKVQDDVDDLWKILDNNKKNFEDWQEETNRTVVEIRTRLENCEKSKAEDKEFDERLKALRKKVDQMKGKKKRDVESRNLIYVRDEEDTITDA